MYCTLPDVLHAAVFWRINKEVSVRSANRFFTLFQNIIVVNVGTENGNLFVEEVCFCIMRR